MPRERIPATLKKTIGKRIRELADESGKTDAELCRIWGLSDVTMWRWTSGDAAPSLTRIIQIADYFDETTDWILGRTNQRKNEP